MKPGSNKGVSPQALEAIAEKARAAKVAQTAQTQK